MAPVSTKSLICPICKKVLNKSGYRIGCVGGCKNYFHPKCINVSDDDVKANKCMPFNCSTCVAKQKSSHDIDEVFNNISDKMKEHISEQTQKCLKDLEAIVDNVMKEFRIELLDKLRIVKDEVKELKEKLLHVECQNKDLRGIAEDCKNQLAAAERHNSIVQRRLNRADILINGLPRSIADLRQPVVKIAEICNVYLNPTDIQHCCYIYGGKSVLVKFNSIHTRDTIMANFFRLFSIRLNDVLDTDVQSRIYLNDHLTPLAYKLVNICRRLRERKAINKYVLINGDVPKVRLTLTNGQENVSDTAQCEKMLTSGLSSSDPNANGTGE